MTKSTKGLSGFSAVVTVACVMAVATIGYFGYTFYTNNESSQDKAVTTQVDDVQTAPTITKPSDLDEAATTIQEAEVENSNMDDMTEIDNELSAF